MNVQSMFRRAAVLALTAIAASVMTQPAPALQRGVAAVVNDRIISDYDVEQRLKLFLALSDFSPSPEQRERLREQIVRSLIDEELQLTEARRVEVEVKAEEVQESWQRLAQRGGVSVEQLEQTLAAAGVKRATLERQVLAEIAWTRLVQRRFGSRVVVEPADVQERLQRALEGATKPQFFVAEVFLAVDSPAEEEQVRQNAIQLAQQARQGVPFAALAAQFSQSASAGQGGDIGWVQDGQLAPELNAALQRLAPGEVSEAIRSGGGYYVLQLRQRREALGEEARVFGEEEDPNFLRIALIVFPMPPDAPADLRARARETATQIHQRVVGCEMARDVARQIPGVIFTNLGRMPKRDIDPNVRAAVERTEPGRAAPPFASEIGVQVIVRCDQPVRRSIAFTPPTAEDIEAELIGQQLSMYARRYLRDLRRDAVIETR